MSDMMSSLLKSHYPERLSEGPDLKAERLSDSLDLKAFGVPRTFATGCKTESNVKVPRTSLARTLVLVLIAGLQNTAAVTLTKKESTTTESTTESTIKSVVLHQAGPRLVNGDSTGPENGGSTTLRAIVQSSIQDAGSMYPVHNTLYSMGGTADDGGSTTLRAIAQSSIQDAGSMYPVHNTLYSMGGTADQESHAYMKTDFQNQFGHHPMVEFHQHERNHHHNLFSHYHQGGQGEAHHNHHNYHNHHNHHHNHKHYHNQGSHGGGSYHYGERSYHDGQHRHKHEVQSDHGEDSYHHGEDKHKYKHHQGGRKSYHHGERKHNHNHERSNPLEDRSPPPLKDESSSVEDSLYEAEEKTKKNIRLGMEENERSNEKPFESDGERMSREYGSRESSKNPLENYLIVRKGTSEYPLKDASEYSKDGGASVPLHETAFLSDPTVFLSDSTVLVPDSSYEFGISLPYTKTNARSMLQGTAKSSSMLQTPVNPHSAVGVNANVESILQTPANTPNLKSMLKTSAPLAMGNLKSEDAVDAVHLKRKDVVSLKPKDTVNLKQNDREQNDWDSVSLKDGKAFSKDESRTIGSLKDRGAENKSEKHGTASLKDDKITNPILKVIMIPAKVLPVFKVAMLPAKLLSVVKVAMLPGKELVSYLLDSMKDYITAGLSHSKEYIAVGRKSVFLFSDFKLFSGVTKKKFASFDGKRQYPRVPSDEKREYVNTAATEKREGRGFVPDQTVVDARAADSPWFSDLTFFASGRNLRKRKTLDSDDSRGYEKEKDRDEAYESEQEQAEIHSQENPYPKSSRTPYHNEESPRKASYPCVESGGEYTRVKSQFLEHSNVKFLHDSTVTEDFTKKFVHQSQFLQQSHQQVEAEVLHNIDADVAKGFQQHLENASLENASLHLENEDERGSTALGEESSSRGGDLQSPTQSQFLQQSQLKRESQSQLERQSQCEMQSQSITESISTSLSQSVSYFQSYFQSEYLSNSVAHLESEAISYFHSPGYTRPSCMCNALCCCRATDEYTYEELKERIPDIDTMFDPPLAPELDGKATPDADWHVVQDMRIIGKIQVSQTGKLEVIKPYNETKSSTCGSSGSTNSEDGSRNRPNSPQPKPETPTTSPQPSMSTTKPETATSPQPSISSRSQKETPDSEEKRIPHSGEKKAPPDTGEAKKTPDSNSNPKSSSANKTPETAPPNTHDVDSNQSDKNYSDSEEAVTLNTAAISVGVETTGSTKTTGAKAAGASQTKGSCISYAEAVNENGEVRKFTGIFNGDGSKMFYRETTGRDVSFDTDPTDYSYRVSNPPRTATVDGLLSGTPNLLQNRGGNPNPFNLSQKLSQVSSEGSKALSEIGQTLSEASKGSKEPVKGESSKGDGSKGESSQSGSYKTDGTEGGSNTRDSPQDASSAKETSTANEASIAKEGVEAASETGIAKAGMKLVSHEVDALMSTGATKNRNCLQTSDKEAGKNTEDTDERKENTRSIGVKPDDTTAKTRGKSEPAATKTTAKTPETAPKGKATGEKTTEDTANLASTISAAAKTVANEAKTMVNGIKTAAQETSKELAKENPLEGGTKGAIQLSTNNRGVMTGVKANGIFDDAIATDLIRTYSKEKDRAVTICWTTTTVVSVVVIAVLYSLHKYISKKKEETLSEEEQV